jgi:hypothetical protein
MNQDVKNFIENEIKKMSLPDTVKTLYDRDIILLFQTTQQYMNDIYDDRRNCVEKAQQLRRCYRNFINKHLLI